LFKTETFATFCITSKRGDLWSPLNGFRNFLMVGEVHSRFPLFLSPYRIISDENVDVVKKISDTLPHNRLLLLL
jgi:hypothetical protein